MNILLEQHNTIGESVICRPSVVDCEAEASILTSQIIEYDPEFARVGIYKPLEAAGYD